MYQNILRSKDKASLTPRSSSMSFYSSDFASISLSTVRACFLLWLDCGKLSGILNRIFLCAFLVLMAFICSSQMNLEAKYVESKSFAVESMRRPEHKRIHKLIAICRRTNDRCLGQFVRKEQQLCLSFCKLDEVVAEQLLFESDCALNRMENQVERLHVDTPSSYGFALTSSYCELLLELQRSELITAYIESRIRFWEQRSPSKSIINSLRDSRQNLDKLSLIDRNRWTNLIAKGVIPDLNESLFTCLTDQACLPKTLVSPAKLDPEEILGEAFNSTRAKFIDSEKLKHLPRQQADSIPCEGLRVEPRTDDVRSMPLGKRLNWNLSISNNQIEVQGRGKTAALHLSTLYHIRDHFRMGVTLSYEYRWGLLPIVWMFEDRPFSIFEPTAIRTNLNLEHQVFHKFWLKSELGKRVELGELFDWTPRWYDNWLVGLKLGDSSIHTGRPTFELLYRPLRNRRNFKIEIRLGFSLSGRQKGNFRQPKLL